jgi:hypothetical protein
MHRHSGIKISPGIAGEGLVRGFEQLCRDKSKLNDLIESALYTVVDFWLHKLGRFSSSSLPSF